MSFTLEKATARWQKYVAGTLLLLALVLTALSAAPTTPANAATLVASGWTNGASPSTPYLQQISNDQRNATDQCGDNSALLFRIRGSGAIYGLGPGKDPEGNGLDALANWSFGAGNRLISKGWRVSDMQAVYDAPPVPFSQLKYNFLRFSGTLIPIAIARSAKDLRSYRDTATNQWRQVANQLTAAARRCDKRKIVIAGYSQGGIVLRYLIRSLPRSVRDQIAHVDLIADPTADDRVDKVNLTHTASLGARVTSSGIDTFLNKANPLFRQAAYPADIARRVTQICVPYDMVCDANLVTLNPWYMSGEGGRHASYNWSGIGQAGVSSMRSWVTGGDQLIASSISAGQQHTCAIRTSRQAVCWGNNDSGRLGDGTAANRSAPTAVMGLNDAISISAGTYHTCAVRTSGQAVCWGNNLSGQLGDGTTGSRSTPTFVLSLTDATSISAGAAHTCAIRNSGQAVCWGWNSDRELGDGTTTNRSTPTPVTGLTDVKSISAGAHHSCAILTSGQAVCWGANSNGELGDGTTTDRSTPTPVTGLTDARSIDAGYSSTCAIRTSGQAVCWGSNAYAQLGDATTTDRHIPTPVTGLTDAKSISAGSYHTCAIRISGQAVCWGNNDSGRLGDDTTTSRSTPTPVTGLADATSISAAGTDSCAIRTSGQALCWGNNYFAHLGDGTSTSRLTPTPVLPGS